MSLEKIAGEIRSCKRCPLHASRTNAVPGEGNPKARVVFVGEAPGRNEDLQGRPFVGAAGKLLTELLASIGLRREDVFITNVVKCRPPNNRDPRPEEIEACLPFLKRQLRVIDPDVIVALGRHSALTLLRLAGREEERSIMRIRGKVFEVELFGRKRSLMPTLHPAAALYNPKLKPLLEEDFKRLKELLGEDNEGKGLEAWF